MHPAGAVPLGASLDGSCARRAAVRLLLAVSRTSPLPITFFDVED